MGRLIDALTGLASPWLYVVVAGFAAAESAALVGLVVPGEVALLVGGFAASQGRVSLSMMIGFATIAAIVGDSIGYELGRHLGPRVRLTRVGRWVGEKRWNRTEQFVEDRGGPAVLLGRWVGLLRALVPGVAGMTRMPYARFLVWNVLGGVVWAPTVVLGGYLAGNSFRQVEQWLGRASLLLLGVVLFVGLGWFAARWAAAHRDLVVAAGIKIRWSSPVRRIEAVVAPVVGSIVDRLRPHAAFAVVLIPAALVIGLSGWALAETFEAVVGSEGIARLDRPVASWFDDHHTAWLTDAMKATSVVGSSAGALVAVGVTSLVGWLRRRTLRPAVTMAGALGGAIVVSQAIKHLTSRPRPPTSVQAFDGFAFPSGHTTVAVAVLGAIAFLCSSGQSWRRQVGLWTLSVSVAALVGFSRAYLGAHLVTDVFGGWLLGTAWLAIVIATDAAVAHRRQLHPDDTNGPVTARGEPPPTRQGGVPPATRGHVGGDRETGCVG